MSPAQWFYLVFWLSMAMIVCGGGMIVYYEVSIWAQGRAWQRRQQQRLDRAIGGTVKG